jgi:hypothetical protein
MGVIEQLGEMLDPVAAKLNQTIASSSVFLHSKLDSIEQAIRESSDTSWQDRWYRITLKKKIKGEQIELDECPQGEIWIVQSLVSQGKKEKTPEFRIEAEQNILFAIEKEINVNLFPGGDCVILPGETLFITSAEEGPFNITLTIIRRERSAIAKAPQLRDGQYVQGRNLHDPERDIITSKTGVYVGTPRETESVDPTVPGTQTGQEYH